MITLRSLTLRRGTKVVLHDVNLTLNPGEKASLVGRNGAGKSSLFSLLANRLQADAGDAFIPGTWRRAEVAQDMPETDEGATTFVLAGDTRLMEAQAQLSAAEAADDGLAMGEAHHALADAGAFDAPARAQALLLGLGFTTPQLDAPVNSFSGGWRMRLQLARALMCPADLLMLDEPTNHLDLDALVWLEAWLKRFEGTLIVISHDREFLDAVTRVTVHLEDTKLTRYGGNYTAFESMRAERMAQQAAAMAKQRDRMAHLQKFIDRFKAKASKAKQAQSRVKALERMEKLAPLMASREFSFEFREPDALPNPMIAMRDLAVGYPGRLAQAPSIIVNGISRTILPGQRLGILGANGKGKSTLIKTLAGALPKLEGTLTEGKGLRLGYFAQQEMDVLQPDDNPMGHMTRLAKQVNSNAREQELRDFLGTFRFTNTMAHQAVGTMSGGEKARLVLAMLVWQRPNLLLLDEPTNHLDLDTREALSMALNEYEGSVLLVSHDRALLREVCDAFWLVSDGQVTDFDGDLDDYQKWLLDLGKSSPDKAAKSNAPVQTPASQVSSKLTPSPSPTPNAIKPKAGGKDERQATAQARQQKANASRPVKQALQASEQAIERDSTALSLMETDLAENRVPPHGLAEHGRRIKALRESIAEQENQWLMLSDQLQKLEA